MWNLRKVLVLSPHTDDAEFGMGGTISRMLSEGLEVHVAALSSARESLPLGWHPDTLVNEMRASMNSIGIPESQLHFFEFPVRQFPSFRQEILEQFVQIKQVVQPDAVFVHASTDVHQDHETVHAEAVRAFKTTSIFGYELPWNTIAFNADLLVALNDVHVDKKVSAISAYRSQQNRSYSDPEYIRGWMRGRGVTIGEKYAEAFEVVRFVIR